MKSRKKSCIEILAPAGAFPALQAAINAGCNAVYFGISHLNMRANAASNFSREDLGEIMELCKKNKVRGYLTLNTLLYGHDLAVMQGILDDAKKCNIDAVILSDMAAAMYANSIGVEVHFSTQLSISNKESCRFYGQFGDRVVLARELTLPMITEITDAIRNEEIRGKSGNLLEVEIFVHGAMCVAVSGRCWMSLYTHNASANRGACVQNCRKPYTVIDQETGKALVIDNEYVMSPEDLCSIDFLDQVVATGVKSLKIEGRGRSPEYVATVVSVYREALTAIEEGTYIPEAIAGWKKRLEEVYNRGLSDGYFFGRHQEHWSKQPGSKATLEKYFVGMVRKYYAKVGVGEVVIQDNQLQQGDRYSIIGPTTGVIRGTAEELVFHEENDEKLFTLKVTERVRPGDKVYVLRERDKK